jgi:hypothetical protein
MAEILKKKELINTRLANNYGGWIYCNNCNQTIGYLCYVTYQNIILEYSCKCGNKGRIHIEKEDPIEVIPSEKPLTSIKNRLCCPEDQSPLITLLEQKLEGSSCKIICKNCSHEYSIKGEQE